MSEKTGVNFELEVELLLRAWSSSARHEVVPKILSFSTIDAMIITAHIVDNLALDGPGCQDEFLDALHKAKRGNESSDSIR